MAKSMLKVLLIAPEYPPGNSVGYMRTIKFEKYLSQLGVTTCILTMRSYGRLPTDKLAHVYRAWDSGMVYRPLASFLLKRKRSTESVDNLAHTPPLWSAYEGTRLNKIRQFILDIFAIPDIQIAWLPFAVLLGLKVIRSEKVDVIYSTSSPETAHLVALCLSKFTRKPWVADFRDGWLFEPLKRILRSPNWRRRLESKFERIVTKSAKAIVTVSQPMSEYFASTYPETHQKVHVITNGYDPDDWKFVRPVSRAPNKFRIVHTGTLFIKARDAYTPLPFLHAIKTLPAAVQDQIELLLVGDLSVYEMQVLDEFDLKSIITTLGRVSRTSSLEYQLSADVLLLIVGNDRSVATSKLFEYLYAKIPVFALSAPDTAAAEIIRQTKSGVIVDPSDSVLIARKLLMFFQLWQTKKLYVNSEHIEKYSRKYLAGQLAEVLNSVRK